MTDDFGRPLFRDGTFPRGRPVARSVFDAAMDTTTPDAFFETFDERLFWGGPWGSNVEAMTRDVRMLRLAYWLNYTRERPRELAEDSWFVVHGIDFHAWLLERGAVAAARYVAELLALYPDGPIADERGRGRHLTALQQAEPDRWDGLRARAKTVLPELAERLRVLLRTDGGRIAAEADAVRERLAEPMPAPLAEVLSAPTSDAEFLGQLTRWLDAPLGRPAIGFDDQPDSGRMLWVLGALVTSLSVSGTPHFLLSHGIGRYFSKLAGWAREVGASETAAYAKAASAELKRLNGGRLPPVGDNGRINAIRTLERADEASGGRGLFWSIDEQYSQAVVAELPRRLRAYAREHAEAIEREQLAVARAK